MMLLCHNILAGQRSAITVHSDTITIGRGSHNQLVLDSPLIAFEAAVLQRGKDSWRVKSLGKNGCKVGDSLVARGAQADVVGTNRIELFPFEITLEETVSDQPQTNPNDELASSLLCKIHRNLLAVMDIETDDTQRRDNPEYQLNLENMIEQLAIEESIAEPDKAELVCYIAGQSVRQSLIESVFANCGNQSALLTTDGAGWSRFVSAVSHREQDLEDVVDRIGEKMDLFKSHDLSQQMDIIEQQFEAQWALESCHLLHDFLLYLAMRSLKKQVKDIVFGYGPLEDLLRIPTISEIMVVDRHHIFIEKKGVVEDSGRRFVSDDVTLAVIDRIVSKVGRRIDKSQPLVDARLLDGSRVNAIILRWQ